MKKDWVRVSLEDMLVAAGHFDAAWLETLPEASRRNSQELALYLEQRGLCHEEDILRAISCQGRYARYLPSDFPISSQGAYLPMFPESEARKAVAVPLQRDGDVLFVATHILPEGAELSRLELITDCEIRPMLCTRSEYARLFRHVYGSESQPEPSSAFQTPLPLSVSEEAAPYGDSSHSEGHRLALRHHSEQSARSPSSDQLISRSATDPLPGDDSETEPPSSAERMVDALLCQAVRDRASDIHISPERHTVHMQLRIDGKLRDIPPPPPEQVLPMISRIKLLAGMNITVNMGPQDGRFTQFVHDSDNRRKEIHIRASCLPTIYGENVVLRLLDAESARIRTLADLGISPDDEAILRTAIHRPYGMILAVGPTGSGKSTTLHSLLHLRNTPDTNIITLEDPVEYRVDGIRQAQLNPRAGMTFASGLRALLRQDPDIIMVGEIRDDETASIAVQAAMTGHLVLSTLHTNDAPGAITRLLDMGVAPYQVASVLLCVVGQRLVRMICPHCATDCIPNPSEVAAFAEFAAFAEGGDMESHLVRKGSGCSLCHQTGYLGRIGLFEVMPIDLKIRAAIRASPCDLARIRKPEHSRPLLRDAVEKIRNGLTTLEEVVKIAMPEEEESVCRTLSTP